MYNRNQFNKEQSAVALGYDKNVDTAPKVVATGRGLIAQQIINIAEENGVPVKQDKELMKVLSLLELNAYIPVEVYSIVAKILSYIYSQELSKKNRT